MQYSRAIAACAAAVLLVTSMATAQETVSYASSANRETRRGETAGSKAGFWLDRGDVSAGDNRRDLIVGAPGWNSNRGRVYVMFAGPVFPGSEVSLAFAETILSGAAAGDRFGETTAAGFVTALESTAPLPNRDLVVGAPGANSGAGAVYLFQRGFVHHQNLTTANAILTITGAPAGALLGSALATGDMDGDGYREIIIGAPGTGAVYVVKGGPAATGTINLSVPSSAFFRIQGSAADGVGRVLAAGDLLGHAIPGGNTIYDLAIGAFNETAGTGAVYVINGRTTASFPAVMNLPADANSRFGGIDAGDTAGRTLQIAMLDTDLFADLIIGAPKAAGPGNARALGGEIYIVWGAATLPSRSLSTADLTVYGAAAGHQEGTALAVGDINRDGFSDFVSLAPGASTSGDLHAFYGRTRALWSTEFDLASRLPNRVLIGDPAAGAIQTTVVYDLTGEGFDDIAVGMPDNVEGLVQISYSVGPGVATGPISRTVNPNSLVTLVATPSGSPTPTIQWQVSTDGTTWTNIAGATATSYSFIATVSDSGKRFRAVFTNSLGTANTAPALLTVRAVAQAARRADLDGDGLSDLVLWRPSDGTWYSLTSGSSFNAGLANQWGNSALGDKPFMGDIDGDGIMDLVIWRPGDGTWYWLTSGTGYNTANAGAKQWGNNGLGDVPMIADMEGDGKADLVIWRASTGTWYWLTSSSGYSYASAFGIQWGNPSLGDKPLLGDFDGDGKQDLAVWRASTGTWYWLTSSSNYSYASARGIQWGNESLGDITLTGDTDGDGKTDLIIWRPTDGTWYWLTSASNYSYSSMTGIQWGNPGLGDIPIIGDFDGDGRADLTVYRTSTGFWYWLTSSSGYAYGSATGRQWGGATDIPMVK
jgi:hypothetical protein